MFTFFSKQRFHESIACATLLAGSVTLQVMWICNLLVVRVPFIREFYSIVPSIGPIFGMYLDAAGAFLSVFILALWYWKGRDCSHHRKHLTTFFLFSTLTFIIMTLPFVYLFSVSFE